MCRYTKLLTTLILIICICVCVFTGYKITTYYYEAYQLEKKYDELENMIKDEPEVEDIKITFESKYEELLKKNSDMVAWITIDDTKINYPIMLTPNNEQYYLRKNFDKKYEFRGTLFFNGDANFDDMNMIIYGHNMDDGTMFGALRKYYKRDYFEDHRYIKLETPEGNRTYEITYVMKTVDNLNHEKYVNYYDFINYTEDEFYNQLALYEKNSIYTTGTLLSYEDKLLTLSTCEYSNDNGRFVIVAKLISEE